MPDPDAPFAVKMGISSELAGRLIGKGGSRINALRKDSGASFKIETDERHGLRMAHLSGMRQELIVLVEGIFSEATERHDEVMNVRLFLPSELVGGIIGQKGSTIGSIRQISRAHVDIERTPPGCQDLFRAIECAGTCEELRSAVVQIVEKMDDTPANHPRGGEARPSRSATLGTGRSGSGGAPRDYERHAAHSRSRDPFDQRDGYDRSGHSRARSRDHRREGGNSGRGYHGRGEGRRGHVPPMPPPLRPTSSRSAPIGAPAGTEWNPSLDGPPRWHGPPVGGCGDFAGPPPGWGPGYRSSAADYGKGAYGGDYGGNGGFGCYGGYGGACGGYGASCGYGGKGAKRGMPQKDPVYQGVLVFEMGNDLAGCIIGRGGATISSIRRTCGGKLEVRETMRPGAGGERVIIMDGSEEEVAGIVNEVFEHLSKFAPNADSHEAVNLDVTLVMPSFQMGAILGHGGKNISAIRADSGAKIRVDSSYGSEVERTAIVSGTTEQVKRALQGAVRTLFEEGKVGQGRSREDGGGEPKRRRSESH